MPDRERVHELFLAARAFPIDVQEPFLRDRCADDPALLHEVRSLLAADRMGGVLDRPIPALSTSTEATDPPLPDRIGPYVLVGDVRQGGMAVVARAHDPRLGREVALKIIRSRFAGSAGRERFIAEARAVSKLDHPHICTIYDIGELEDGRLHLAMPYYGEGTLADRLRAGPLPPADAVRTALQVADALDAAHRAGIVHRDVKPANIAFDDRGAARLLDFGIAMLDDESGNAAGLAAGTPAYMAPEQARGERVDRRADLWALGRVVLEMLSGGRPVGAEAGSPAGEAGASSLGTRVLPPETPTRVARVVEKALQADPDLRFQSAGEMKAALLRSLPSAASGRSGIMSRSGRTAAFVTLVALAAVGTHRMTTRRGPSTAGAAVSPDLAVVLPFRVSADSTLAYLREGMVDLLAAKLTGEGGLRAVDPRLVHQHWNETRADPAAAEALGLARRLGAGRVILGEVVGGPRWIVLTAALLDDRGTAVGRGSVSGVPDQLPDLVDGLVARLLSTSAGEPEQRLAALTSTSLPALRSFLEGQASYRRGRYQDALLHYSHALEHDSTFALAGLGLALTGGWMSGGGAARERGGTLAWAFRDRLSARDRDLLTAVVGPGFPGPSSVRAVLTAVERALLTSPDRLELWFQAGDLYFHFGRVIAEPAWRERAGDAFRRALELDPTFAPATHHLAALHGYAADTAALARLAVPYLADTPTGATADYIRWRSAAEGVETGQPGVPPLDSMEVETLGWIAMNAQDEGFSPDDALRAAELASGRPGTTADLVERRAALFAILLNAGRPSAALRALEPGMAVSSDPTFIARIHVLTGLYADGDPAGAFLAAAMLAEASRRGTAGTLDRCVLELWNLRSRVDRSDPDRVPALEAPAASTTGKAPPIRESICLAVLAAERESAGSGGASTRHRDALEVLLRSGASRGPLVDGHTEYARIALAHLFVAAGDTAEALASHRRRPYFIGWDPYLGASLREEALLAGLAGDTAGAIAAGHHFLALRGAPEPAALPGVRDVRSMLAGYGALSQ